MYFDGACGLCVRSIRFLKSFDRSGVLLPRDASDKSVISDLYRRTGRTPDINRSMWSLAAGCLYEGYDAFRIAFEHIPSLRAFAYVMRVRPVRWAGRAIYRAVASNRRRLGCSSTCSVSAPGEL